MKRARIGITNDRRQKLEELEKASREVMARHAELLEINSAKDARKIKAIRRRVGEDNLSTLSKYCLSLFSELAEMLGAARTGSFVQEQI